MKQLGKYTFFLIAGYLAVTNYTGLSKDISAGAAGFQTGVKTLQGR
jgi:hypothetical protein